MTIIQRPLIASFLKVQALQEQVQEVFDIVKFIVLVLIAC